MKKMWSILVHLGVGFSPNSKDVKTLCWDDSTWDMIVDGSVKAGLNTIVLDVNDGMEFASHPEIAINGAWSIDRMKKEIHRCRELGLALIPKLNFSAAHSMWLGVYHRMTSTPTYYKVCNDLIKEVYEVFEHPEYIHIGMDEEDIKHVRNRDYVMCRQGELYWHDLRFLIDCVKETGAMPWMWSCPLFSDPEGYKKHIGPKEVLLSPWHYNAVRKEHWTHISTRAEYVAYYNEGEYASMGIEYVEQDPFLVRFMELALPLMKEGYLYAPCVSVFNRCPHNTHDIVEYFKENAPDDQIIGYMTAPWFRTLPEKEQYFAESFDLIKIAKEDFYSEG